MKCNYYEKKIVDIPISPLIKEDIMYRMPKLLLKPYTHQINNINWMISIEKQVDLGTFEFKYIDLHHLLYYNKFYMNSILGILYDKISIWNDQHRIVRLNLRGGVICDEVGLGKTFSATALIASDIAPIISIDTMKPITKKPASKIKIAIKKKTKTPHTSVHELSGTLVVCPRRLVEQWKSEINKYTNALKVLEMSTMTHIKKYCWPDCYEIHDAHVVICSYSMFSNKRYQNYDGFKLSGFKWKRLIIDEGHEVLLNSLKRVGPIAIRDEIMNIDAKYKWVITGTPISNGVESFDGILSYLVSDRTIKSHHKSLTQDNINDLVRILFKKHDKESIKEEVLIPKVTIETVMLNFTPTEKEIYDSCCDPLRKLKLCTNIMISEEDSKVFGGKALSLDQINQAMSNHHQKEIEILKKRIDNAEKEISNLKQKLHGLSSPTDKRNIKSKIRYREDIIDEFKNSIKFNQKKVALYTSFNLNSMIKKKCPIMGSKLGECDDIAITSTGRCYSGEGIRLLFTNKKTIFCPVSRQSLTMTDIKFVDPSSTDTSNNNPLVDRWGTKMASMIEKLGIIFTNSSSKVIIFSQWNKMLDLVSMVLTESNIKHVFCRGNVHVMSKSINRFKTDPSYKVILLSSENCSSGSNLTEANHIFLLDRMNSDRDNATAIEEQAIARAVRLGQTNSVIVTKFIMQNTIEETYHGLETSKKILD